MNQGSTEDVHMNKNTLKYMLSCTDLENLGNIKTKTNVRMSFQLYLFIIWSL